MKVVPNGKVVLITGANTGIGRVAAIELAMQGYHMFLACRDREKTEAVLLEIHQKSGGAARAEFLPLDLADLSSVRACAQLFLSQGLPLHLLINNAGLAGVKGFTQSGFELAFGVCHVGHFLLTDLLLPTLKESAPSRIVNVSSRAHLRVKRIDYDAVTQPTRGVGALKAYAVAKLANLLFTVELARRLQGTGVTAYALHPGVVGTDVWRSLPTPIRTWTKRFMLTPEQGAATTLYCATSNEVAHESGHYYDNCKVKAHNPLGHDAHATAELWQRSEKWVAEFSASAKLAQPH